MPLSYAVLGKDQEITDSAVPVIAPNWRLKRSGDWPLLVKYEAEQINYSRLTPLMAATLALMDGKLSFRHLALVVQYTHDFPTLERSKEFVAQVIRAANQENDAVVQMEPALAPFLKRVDPLDFVVLPDQESMQQRPAAPLSLNLMFSNDCQTSCSYCYAQRRKVPNSRQLPARRWIEIFHEAKAAGLDQVSLSGGDPLFRRDALILIGELIKLDFLFLLSTKCHITRFMTNRLIQIGMTQPVNQFVRELQLSMDGADAETADAMAGSPGFFNRSLDSIRNLVGRGFNLRVKAVITPRNAGKVYEWISLMEGLGVTKLSVAAYSRTLYRHDDSYFLDEQQRALIAEQCQRAQADFPELELRMTGLISAAELAQQVAVPEPKQPGSAELQQAWLREKEASWKTRSHCSGGRSSMTVTPDGKVVLCDTIPQEGAFVVGDLRTQSLMEVWNSKELLDFVYPPRERFAGSACFDCPDLDECRSKAGYCFRDSHFNYGNAFAPPPKCPRAPDDGMRMD
jgi:radical SAM protein with 4Fe4S-binding SPASM domain